MKDNVEFYQDGGEPTGIENLEMLGVSDDDNRDGMEPMESLERLRVEMSYSLTATGPDLASEFTPDSSESKLSDDDDDAVSNRSDDSLDVAGPVSRYPIEPSLTIDGPDHAAFGPDHRPPSRYDVDALAGNETARNDAGHHCLEVTDHNSFVNDPENFRGVASEDEHEMGRWGNGHPALSERSESPRHSEPPSRSSTASPTTEQLQLGRGAVHKFEHNQAVDEPYSPLRRYWVSPYTAVLSPELAAAAAAAADTGPWSAE